MLDENGKFSFADIKLVSKHKAFYFKNSRNRLYEVSEEQFRIMFVTLGRNSVNKENSIVDRYNKETFEFLFEQLEITEELFTAQLYSMEDWII